MDITFERGDKTQPKGHALIYFRSSSAPDELWVTYLVILPIAVDVAKYVPPFLMNQVGELGAKDLSAFAFPPAPEKIEGHGYLERLAEMRDDDILFGGTINPEDVTSGMMSINEAVQRYAQAYSEVAEAKDSSDVRTDEGSDELGISEVLYGLMSDGDKLSELTKLVGKLRFSVEGGEKALIKEAETDISLLARHLPENHRVRELVEAAKEGGAQGDRLAELYLKRCFHLMQEQYVELGHVEEQLRTLEGGESST